MGNISSCWTDADGDNLRPGPDPGSGTHTPEGSRTPRVEDPRRLKGARVNVFKQDPSVKYVGLREQWLPVEIYRGPKTRDVEIRGLSRQYGPTDNQGNYLYDPDFDSEGFDAVNTLSVIQNVLWMYRRALRKLKSRRDIRWNWGNSPLHVYPRAGKKANAFYSRDEKVLKFFYFDSGGRTIFSCQSWDIVSHEVGHAILDGLKPGWLSSTHVQTNALHEAFGDITALLSILDQLDMCEVIVAKTKGNLSSPNNLLAALGEEFSKNAFGIRNAHFDVKISQTTEQSHDLSKVFTGAIYDFLIQVFTNTLNLNTTPPAETLYKAAAHVSSLFLLAVLKAPDTNATFRHVADIMIQEEPQRLFKSFMQMEFGRREIFDPAARPKSIRHFAGIPSDCYTCQTITVCKNLKRDKTLKSRDSRETRGRMSQGNRASTDMPEIRLDNLPVFEEEPSRRRSRPTTMEEHDVVLMMNGVN